MPYIEKAARSVLTDPLTTAQVPRSAGELNFCITHMIKRYLHENGESYQRYNDIIGALEGAKMELYRRRVSLYEDDKIASNGDIW